MAESELERAQKAIRSSSDFYDVDEDEDDDDDSVLSSSREDVYSNNFGASSKSRNSKQSSSSINLEEEKKTPDQLDNDVSGKQNNHTTDRNEYNTSRLSLENASLSSSFADIPLTSQSTKVISNTIGISGNSAPVQQNQQQPPSTSSDKNWSPSHSRAIVSDFDPLNSSSGDVERIGNEFHHQPSSLAHQQVVQNTSSILFSTESRSLSSRIPAPNSLFDDDDSTAASIATNSNNFIATNDDGIGEGGMIGVELSEFLDGANGLGASDAAATTTTATRTSSSTVPGAAGYLEMEEEPPRSTLSGNRNENEYHNDDFMINDDHGSSSQSQPQSSQQIRTDSGLYLTHRKPTITASTTTTHNRNSSSSTRQFSLHPQHQPTTTSSSNSNHSFVGGMGGFRNVQHDYFSGANGFFRNGGSSMSGGFGSGNGNGDAFGGLFGSSSMGSGSGGQGRNSMVMLQARRFMSLVRVWLVIGAMFVLLTTGAFFHSLNHNEIDGDVVAKSNQQQQGQQSIQDSFSNSNGIAVAPPQEILLLPLDDISKLTSSSSQYHFDHASTMGGGGLHPLSHNHQHQHRRLLSDLRQEFEQWVAQHNKIYHSVEEKDYRFSVWTENHYRTHEKNRRHGPCRLTKQPVFGSNHFKDLSPEEFKGKYLTGYKGIRTDELHRHMETLPSHVRKLRTDTGQVLNPKNHKVNIHESVRQRHLKYHPNAGPVFDIPTSTVGYGASSPNCDWYDLSCYLRWVWYTYGISLGGLAGTMEPAYDSDSYPNSVDWRDSGAVTDIRTQSSCGACWAITAVETIESAHYISTGQLYDLAETEIIACDDSCEMCDGGWPQNAYSWVMKYGGLPLSSTMSYDADTMVTLTAARQDEDEYTVESLRSGMCPASDASSRSNDSGDENTYWEESVENENYGDYSSQGRYGNIKGYGYATDRCLCYSDGSGCDCEDQDEDLAVRNLATYGPAAVCLEASLWQDYSGGIITSDIGCGQEFLDMNHCVQVVGYAFTTDSDDAGEEDAEGDENQQQQSHSGSNDRNGSGSSDTREGYWIVRNQWGNSWGMNGYAYVAMGENTCGILNDMTQAYL